MGQPIRVLLADDSSRARDGLRALLSTWPDVLIVGEAADGREAVRLVGELQPHVVLMDLQMPLLDGIQATRQIKQLWPAVVVIILTIYITEQSAALAAGADAFLIKGEASVQLLNTMVIEAATSHPHE